MRVRSLIAAVCMAGMLLSPSPAAAGLFGDFTLQDEMKMGREFEVLVKSTMPIIEDPVVRDYVQGVVDRIVKPLPPQPYKFPANVVLHNSLNAFAAPGGFVFVFSGLIMHLNHESELAGVLSHEVAHVTQRHIAGRMEREISELSSPAFLVSKADAAIGRLISSMKKAQKGDVTYRYMSAIGTSGLTVFHTLFQKADKTYAVTDKYGLGYLFMGRLCTALERAGFSMIVCPSPLIRSRPEGIFVEDENIFFAVCDEQTAQTCDKTINITRFISKEYLTAHRGRLRFSAKCAASLLDGAMESLAQAGRLHAETEKIYGQFVDFTKVDSIKSTIISEIFANNM